ncbi:carbohydrate ABC transporter permease [Breznakiella homolactica]|uniref:Carbohydrate ABC transporter permease n=1 Tax=Breznakiella homolactica TaxID=2798577 RepID=A0A7T7XQW6_9SPIR|nr:carbohydrate ABC transporter permease [Breznakiella homolactica]QQO10844.1 carbohydrate ABC transporter permease [Breznakiella homolactica]
MIAKKQTLRQIPVYLLLAVVTFVTLLPLAWMLSASLKLDSEVFTVPIQWIPRNPLWSNYVRIWEKIDFLQFTFNSFKLSIIITIIQVITSSFAAYGFTKCHFPGRDALFFVYIATIAIPWQVYMLPQYVEMRMMHLTNSHLGYILMQSFIAFGVFLIRQFYQSIPDELLDAARIDGLNEYGIYFRVVLPLSKPVLATLSIFSFVTIWNDFMGPMIYFDSVRNKTIPLGIRMFLGQYSTEYGLIMAASVVSLIPVFAVFLSFQRFFVQGIATSGLKG